ncbi:hypothetical protein ColTof4_07817 [Colletotrichum tofieldiae]|uniref:Uncharacterized protein n=1 Tax=Colletotrichum tofieldiae TaxID=708197 RepID=A0A166WWD9_9PEZI|nr:hypothetical protein CT0861_08344 [Colletotrichum tofieldiae]GKT55315.1 hypothetical protein ColTof3_02654 [Colletotrichum tofieldiae]GKT75394.1 hypothetical protein ColTof4_07817 [Colletotrichum tofieldiae]GKT83060.1 hypothetical protein Ct61P_00910 [Colletotrichum tofieldiae]
MNAPIEDDRSSAGPKFIFERHEERKIRRRLLQSAFFFDIIAVALVISLCIGGWTRSNSGYSTSTMSEDSHLVTWSAAYRRNATGLRRTFVMSWFLSSSCYMEEDTNYGPRHGGCIHRMPGSPFDLDAIMAEITIKLVETDNLDHDGDGEGMFEGLEDLALSAATTITASRDALASYVIFSAMSLGVWVWHGIVRKNSIEVKPSSWRIPAYSQGLAAIALLVASAITTAVAYKADGILGKYEDVFRYHSAGTSFAAMTWCAFVSHLLGLLAYVGSVLMCERLDRPELYPPEPEPEPGTVPPALAGHGVNRGNRRDAPVHREQDPNDVDDELPPYSRVDPYEMSISRREGRRSRASRESLEDIELGAVGNRGHTDDVDLSVPAPDYELHERPSDRGVDRVPGGST